MAIKRLDPTRTFDIVTFGDDAILHETAEELVALSELKQPTRWEKYKENMELKELKFVDGKKPDLFVIRCLKNDEKAGMHEKYLTVDVEKKTMGFRNKTEMIFETFDMACLGIRKEDGSIEKVTRNEIPYVVAMEVGSTITMLSELSKNEKKS